VIDVLQSCLLLLTGVLIYVGWSVEEFWPLAALGLGLLISGWTFLLQEATFGSALAGFYAEEPGGVTIDEELGLRYLDLPKLRPDQVDLAEFGKEFKAQVAAEDNMLHATERVVTERLELSLVGSFGFWTTIGLLAGWTIFHGQRLTIHAHAGPTRCFRAHGALKAYHDMEYGVQPSNDGDLYRRFSLELLSCPSTKVTPAMPDAIDLDR
jgi:hypothetical protein